MNANTRMPIVSVVARLIDLVLRSNSVTTVNFRNHPNLLGSFGESHGHCIHAIAQTRGTRPIVEHMAQVRVTQPAGNRGARLAQTAIFGFHDVLFRDGRPEAWPARA